MVEPRPPQVKKITELLPKTFSGQKTSKIECQGHLLKFQDYLNFHEIEDFHTILQRFKFTLEGKARLWADNQEVQNCEELETLKTLFVAQFSPPETKFNLVRDFEKLKCQQGKDLNEFADKLRRKAAELD